MIKPRPGRHNVTISLELPPSLLASLEALAERRGNARNAEIREAIQRHLASPPVLVPMPALPVPVPVPEEPPQPKKPRGRPRKHPVNGEAKPKRPVGRPRKQKED